MVPFIGHNTLFMFAITIFVIFAYRVRRNPRFLRDSTTGWSMILRYTFFGSFMLLIVVFLVEPFLIRLGGTLFGVSDFTNFYHTLILVMLILPTLFYWMVADFFKMLFLLDDRWSFKHLIRYAISTVLVRVLAVFVCYAMPFLPS